MNEASTALIEQVARVMQQRGLDPRPLFDGLPLTLEQALASSRMDWEPFTRFLENLAATLGSVEAFCRFFEDVNAGFPLWQGFAQMFISPRDLVHLAVQFGRGLYTCGDAWAADLMDGRIHLRQEIQPGYRATPWLAYATAGLCQGLPRALGLPPATVEITLDDHSAELIVALPPGKTMMGRSMAEFLPSLFAGSSPVHAAGKAAPTWVPGATLEPLAKRLVEHRELEAFAREAMSVLREHLEMRRAAIWMREGAEQRLLAREGPEQPPLSSAFVLSIDGAEVGRLELESEVPPASEPGDVLAKLLPWLAVGLDRARTSTALRDHEEQLKQEIEARRLVNRPGRVA